MRKSFHHFAIKSVVLALCLGVAAISAKADTIYNVDLNFQSGASFTGTVTLSDNYSIIDGVSGTLYGYSSSTFGYVGGTATDPISWVFYPKSNEVASGGDVSGNYLMDTGTVNGDYSNWVDFTYDYTNAPNLILAPDAQLGTDPGYYPSDGVNYNPYGDDLVSGSITPATSPVPEPPAITLLLLGVFGLSAYTLFERRKMSQSAITHRVC